MSAMSADMALEENDRRKHDRKPSRRIHSPHRYDALVLCGELVAMIGLAIAFLVVAMTVGNAIGALLFGGAQ